MDAILTIFLLFLIVFSLYGYGCLAEKALFTTLQKSLGFSILTGYCLYLAAAGYIEFFRIGGTSLLQWYLLIGLLIGIVFSIKTRLFGRIWQAAWLNTSAKYRLVNIALIVLILLYLLNAMYRDFNLSDDYQGYIVFAKRILEEGFQGGDPFNKRVIEQGFGGGNSINALFLSVTPLKYIHIADSGIGLLLLLALAMEQIHCKDGIQIRRLTIFLTVYLVAIFAPISNISPVLAGCAITYGILRFYSSMSSIYSWRQAILVGIFLGGLILLKGTLLIPMAVCGSSFYIARFFMLKKGWVITEIFISLASLIILLSPWLLSNYGNYGTAFFPLLGKGYSISEGLGLISWDNFVDNFFQYLPMYGLICVFWLALNSYTSDVRMRVFSTCFMLLTVVATLSVGLTTGGDFRYHYVALATPAAYLCTYFVGIYQPQNFYYPFTFWKFKSSKGILIALLIISVGLVLNDAKRVGFNLFHDALYLRDVVSHKSKIPSYDLLSKEFNEQQIRYQKLQALIPQNEKIFAVVEIPFLFDFHQNKFYIADILGSAGLDSGASFTGETTDLAKYFLSHHIRYIVHSYRFWLTATDFPEMHNKIDWISSQTTRYFLANKRLITLENIYSPIYDNGNERVFDLCKSPPTALQKLCD